MKTYICPACGKTNTDSWLLKIDGKILHGGCQKCWEKETFPTQKPIRDVPEKDLYSVMLYANDQWEHGSEYLRDGCEREGDALPETVQIGAEKQYLISFTDIISFIEENMYEELGDDDDFGKLKFDDLKPKFEEWMKLQDVKYYEAGETVKVIWEDSNPLKKCLDSAIKLNNKEIERVQKKSDNPFCGNCLEEFCEVSTDGTCKMVRVYLNKKKEGGV